MSGGLSLSVDYISLHSCNCMAVYFVLMWTKNFHYVVCYLYVSVQFVVSSTLVGLHSDCV